MSLKSRPGRGTKRKTTSLEPLFSARLCRLGPAVHFVPVMRTPEAQSTKSEGGGGGNLIANGLEVSLSWSILAGSSDRTGWAVCEREYGPFAPRGRGAIMRLTSWIDSLRRKLNNTAPRRRRRTASGQAERLEDRTLLSATTLWANGSLIMAHAGDLAFDAASQANGSRNVAAMHRRA